MRYVEDHEDDEDDEEWGEPGGPEGWLMRALRADGVLHVNTVDSELWAASPYWAVRVDGDYHPVTRLLAAYNLKAEPMDCDVDSTVFRTERKVPDFAPIFRPSEGVLPPMCVSGAPVLVDTGNDIGAVYGPLPNGELLALSRRYLGVLNRMGLSGGEWHHSGSAMGACSYMVGDSRRAVLMPIRTSLRAP